MDTQPPTDPPFSSARYSEAVPSQETSRGQTRQLGRRVVDLFDELRAVLEVWEQLDDTDQASLREVLDPVGDVLAAMVEVVADHLDASHHPISQHRLDGLRRLRQAPDPSQSHGLH